MKVRRIILLTAAAATVSIAVASAGQAGSGGTAITACGQVVGTSAYLTQDLYCPGSHGVVVAGPGVTVDLKGFTLRGDRTAGKNGVDDQGFDGVTITNGVVRNFDVGVHTTNTGDAITVSNLIVTGNASSGIAINGKSATVKSSVASANGDFGMFLNGDSATITSSTASANGLDGIYVSSDGARIKSATSFGNGNFGIYVFGDGNTVQSSTASANAVHGIFVSGDAAVLKGNRADGNGFAGDVSDLSGLGIKVLWFSPAPVGTNVAHGNDDPAECTPSYLC